MSKTVLGFLLILLAALQLVIAVLMHSKRKKITNSELFLLDPGIKRLNLTSRIIQVSGLVIVIIFLFSQGT